MKAAVTLLIPGGTLPLFGQGKQQATFQYSKWYPQPYSNCWQDYVIHLAGFLLFQYENFQKIYNKLIQAHLT